MTETFREDTSSDLEGNQQLQGAKNPVTALFEFRFIFLNKLLKDESIKEHPEESWHKRLIRKALCSTWGDLMTLGVDPKQLLKNHEQWVASQTRDNQPPL